MTSAAPRGLKRQQKSPSKNEDSLLYLIVCSDEKHDFPFLLSRVQPVSASDVDLTICIYVRAAFLHGLHVGLALLFPLDTNSSLTGDSEET